MSYIVAIETAVPEFRHSQEALVNFYQQTTDDENIRRKIRAVGMKAGISNRYSVISDFSNRPEDFTFFPKNRYLVPEPDIDYRMSIYKQNACRLSINAISKIQNFDAIKASVTHIITVSCTGFSAPGLDIEIIRELCLSPHIQRSSVNFMGCNAAILALKNADTICRSTPSANVLIVCTELCTIHVQKDFTEDYLLASALFADGCAAVLLSATPQAYTPNLKIESFHSTLLHDGYNEMAWQITRKGFIINLTSYVSQLINGAIKQMLDSIAINPADIDHWAVHPGGKKILDDFTEALLLPKAALKESHDVLSEYGNMSSATVLFVLKKIVEESAVKRVGEKIFTAAFGPGLSVETMQLIYV